MSTNWLKKWEEGDIGFHQGQFHPQLEKYSSFYSPGTILVPLCGKSLDMLYLSKAGHSVIGVELSPIACHDFFQENGIKHTETKVQDFVIYKSENITLWCGDFFKLPQEVWNQTSGIYDRAAYIALPEEIRLKYAEEITKKAPRKFEILMITVEYAEGAIQGPPFSIPEQEVKNLYKEFSIQKLQSETKERVLGDPSKLQTVGFTETVYWLKRPKA
ncbi:MAG: thiopurine S-methyltransferase [Bacteriovoracia bacterium]